MQFNSVSVLFMQALAIGTNAAVVPVIPAGSGLNPTTAISWTFPILADAPNKDAAIRRSLASADLNSVEYHAIARRQAKGAAALKPSLSVSLLYGASGAATTASIAARQAAAAGSATVDGTMRLPSIVLEGISSVTAATCSATGITVPFTSATDYATAKGSWPTSGATMITSSDGGCADAGQRGFYTITGLTFDDATNTITVAATKSTLEDSMAEASIDYVAPTSGGAQKRGLDVSISADLSGKTLVKSDPVTVVANTATYTGSVRVSGSIKFNFLKFKLSKCTVDLDYNSDLNLNITTTASLEKSLYDVDYTPLSQAVSAFSIPGILDVGPMVEFALGLSVGAAGQMTLTTDLQSSFVNSNVHLDLLNNDQSSVANWKPTTKLGLDLDASVSLSVNPYAKLTVAMGIKAFKNAVDLTAGVSAKPMIVNTFNAAVALTYDTSANTGVVFKAPTDDAKCVNGAWFASTFHFGVEAYVGSIWSKDLYTVDVPIYESQCWSVGKSNLNKRAEIAAF